jgi:hypothetical protein
MQNIIKNQFLVFILGLIAGAILIFLIFSYKDNLLNALGLSSNSNPDIIITIDDNDSDDSKIKKKVKKTIIKTNTNDSLLNVSKNDSLKSALDSLNNSEEIVYSFSKDSIDVENIVVAKDMLLMAKKYKPSGNPIVFYCDDPNSIDSLLIDNNIQIPKDGLLVEFWKSPVNFKGYRLTTKKLVLYGIYDFSDIKFTYKVDALIMNFNGKDFLLRCNDEFIPANFGNIKRVK